MNREIKFRAWDKENKCWAPSLKTWKDKECDADNDYDFKKLQLYLSFDGHVLEETYEHGVVDTHYLLQGKPKYTLVEFTGLKDKNGKEIYEEDILVYRDNMSVDRPGVKFDSYSLVSFGNYDYGSYEQNESGYGWFLKPITDKEGLGLNANYSKLLEVIGNIYENPELLKGIDNV